MTRRGLDAVAEIGQFLGGPGRPAALEIGLGVDGFEARLELAGSFDGLRLAAGVLPDYAEEFGGPDDPALEVLARQLEHPAVVAVGETGLDWYHSYGTRDAQIGLFEAQLCLAAQRDLPVVIHNREADVEVIACLDRHRPGAGGIAHCFSSDRAAAARLLDRGFAISFAGNVTYPGSHNLRDVARWVPDDLLLLETDSPYLAPQAVRGAPNRPGFVEHTYRCIAEVRGIPVEQLAVAVRRNFDAILHCGSGPGTAVL